MLTVTTYFLQCAKEVDGQCGEKDFCLELLEVMLGYVTGTDGKRANVLCIGLGAKTC